MKEYDLVVDYHLRKANIVADAFSQKLLFSLRVLNAQLILNSDGFVLAELKARSLFLHRIKNFQDDDLKLIAKREQIQSDQSIKFRAGNVGMLNFCNKLCVLNDLELKRDILSKTYSSTHSIHLVSTKMFCVLKQMYWWLAMKCEILELITKCLVCQ